MSSIAYSVNSFWADKATYDDAERRLFENLASVSPDRPGCKDGKTCYAPLLAKKLVAMEQLCEKLEKRVEALEVKLSASTVTSSRSPKRRKPARLRQNPMRIVDSDSSSDQEVEPTTCSLASAKRVCQASSSASSSRVPQPAKNTAQSKLIAVDDLSATSTHSVPAPGKEVDQRQVMSQNDLQPVARPTQTEEAAEEVAKTPASTKPGSSRPNGRPKVGKIFVFGDSQVQNLSCAMKGIIPKDIETCVFSRPGCNFSDTISVVEDVINDRSNNISDDDIFVIVSGSNDVGRGHLRYSETKLQKLAKKVKLVVSQIPIRWDLPVDYERFVNVANTNISGSLPKWGGKFMAVNSNGRDFTKHGLHYNMKGKVKLAKAIQHFVNHPF